MEYVYIMSRPKPNILLEITNKKTYTTDQVLEADAIWAANQKGETAKGLEACANKTLYKVYPPTPKTKEWLIGCGFMKPENGYYPYYENKKKQECIAKK